LSKVASTTGLIIVSGPWISQLSNASVDIPRFYNLYCECDIFFKATTQRIFLWHATHYRLAEHFLWPKLISSSKTKYLSSVLIFGLIISKLTEKGVATPHFGEISSCIIKNNIKIYKKILTLKTKHNLEVYIFDLDLYRCNEHIYRKKVWRRPFFTC